MVARSTSQEIHANRASAGTLRFSGLTQSLDPLFSGCDEVFGLAVAEERRGPTFGVVIDTGLEGSVAVADCVEDEF